MSNITKEYVDRVAPEHGRTSCSDGNLSNRFGGWTGKYNRGNGNKEIQVPRCTRCYLLDHLGEDIDDLEFEAYTYTLLAYKDK